MHPKPTYRIKTISEYHQIRGLPKPVHPLISIIDCAAMQHSEEITAYRWLLDFYSISLKRTSYAKAMYGQQPYDFDAGILYFSAPMQVFSFEMDEGSPVDFTGWIVLIHPDFLWNTALAKKIMKYDFFGYAVHEALFLSEKEEACLNNLIENIGEEQHSTIDRFSQNIIISQLETLLSFAERFYERQFITRKNDNYQVLEKLENLLDGYFRDAHLSEKGLPTVEYVSAELHISANYLSTLLKNLTGQSTKQHIQGKLIAKAKELLSTTPWSISEIAFRLGFEHSQSFSRIFKGKTKLSPSEFRQSFH